MNFADYLNLAQGLGILAFLFDATAFMIKDDKRQITLRTFGCLIWIFHYNALGKMVPAIFLGFDFLRFATANYVRARPKLLLPITAIFGVFYICTGILFQNTVIDFLPTITAVFACYCTYMLRGIHMRLGFALVMASWMTYNYLVHSIGGVINDFVVVIINFTTIYRMIRDQKAHI